METCINKKTCNFKPKNIWVFITILSIITLGIIIWSAPRLLNLAFEKSTKMLEKSFIEKAPPEYSSRIHNDFENFILAFKEGNLKKEDLKKLSKLIQSTNEDGELVQEEIDELLEFIETITPGLR